MTHPAHTQTEWSKIPQERRDAYNAKKRAEYAKVGKKPVQPRTRARKATPQDMMLRDFMLARTAHEKRQVIQSFNPLYFVFGYELKESNDEQ